MVGLSQRFPRSRRFGRYNLTYLDPDQETEVDALVGACMLLRREAIGAWAPGSGTQRALVEKRPRSPGVRWPT